VNLAGSSDVLSLMGWAEDGDALVLPSNIKLDFQLHVVKIVEAKDWFLKEKEKMKLASRRAADPNKADMLHQLELDRQERLASQNISAPTTTAMLHQEKVDRQERLASQNSLPTSQTSPQPKRSPLAVLGAAAAQASGISTSQASLSLSSPPGSPSDIVLSPQMESSDQSESSTFIAAEAAEVVILEGTGAGNWVSCKIVGPGSTAESYDIYILPTTDYDNVGGFAGKNIPDMPAQHLRKACWTCHQCTLINKVSSARCETCGAISPSHDKPSGLSRACGDCTIC